MAKNRQAEPAGSGDSQPELLNHWGDVLLYQARTEKGGPTDDLIKAACEKYEQALEIKPDMSEALVGLGCARLALAGRTVEADSRQNLLGLARESLLAAQELSAKAAAYNLGCERALAGDLDECRGWLQISRDAGHLPPRKQLLEDADLASVRQEEWFDELLGQV